MKIKEIYICENCNETFNTKEECQKHELKCNKPYLPSEKGCEFNYCKDEYCYCELDGRLCDEKCEFHKNRKE